MCPSCFSYFKTKTSTQIWHHSSEFGLLRSMKLTYHKLWLILFEIPVLHHVIKFSARHYQTVLTPRCCVLNIWILASAADSVIALKLGAVPLKFSCLCMSLFYFILFRLRPVGQQTVWQSCVWPSVQLKVQRAPSPVQRAWCRRGRCATLVYKILVHLHLIPEGITHDVWTRREWPWQNLNVGQAEDDNRLSLHILRTQACPVADRDGSCNLTSAWRDTRSQILSFPLWCKSEAGEWGQRRAPRSEYVREECEGQHGGCAAKNENIWAHRGGNTATCFCLWLFEFGGDWPSYIPRRRRRCCCRCCWCENRQLPVAFVQWSLHGLTHPLPTESHKVHE